MRCRYSKRTPDAALSFNDVYKPLGVPADMKNMMQMMAFDFYREGIDGPCIHAAAATLDQQGRAEPIR